MWSLVKHDQLFLRAKKTQALVGVIAIDNAIPKLSIGSQTGSGKKLRNFCTCALTISLLLNTFIVIFFALPGRYWRIDCSVKE